MTDNQEESAPYKQVLSDTYLSFLPKNTAGLTTKDQIVDIQIPRTEHVLRLNAGYVQVDLECKFTINSTDANNATQYIGLNNAACIFDQSYIKNNGKTIDTNTFTQVKSRVWQMSKSSNYLNANPASFINYDNIAENVGYLVHPVKNLLETTTDNLKFKLRIPLPCIFPCFENCDNFSTTQLNDDITLSLQLSEPDKYMNLFTVDSTGKIIKVEPFNGSTVSYSTKTVTVYDGEDQYRIQSLKIITPGHYPTDDERVNYSNLIANGAVHYNFKDVDIRSQAADFSAAGSTTALNFSTNVENIFAVLILASHYHSYTVFDKPYISDIECNLSEIFKLAVDKVHTKKTYENDNDMYYNLLDGFGTGTFKNIQRFDKAITHDYSQKGARNESGAITSLADVQLTGNYIQWYKVACGNQMGVSANYFANLINYKFKNETATGSTAVNFASSTVFCCQLCQRMLIYKEGGLDIVCPFAQELDARAVMNDDINSSAHGLGSLIPSLLQPATGLFKSVGRAIKDQIYRIKSNKNTTYAYTKLGKEGYEKHRDIIDENRYMGTRKFKRFINNLAQSEKQLENIDTHGLIVRHGAMDDGSLGEGPGSASSPAAAASTVPRSSLDDFEHERPVDLDLLNLTCLYRQSYNEELADCSYKMLLVMDYKWGFNRVKIRLQSFGDESAAEYCGHGLGSWLRDKWRKVTGFFKGRGKEMAKQAGKALLSNAAEIAKKYANEILQGKLTMKDIPAKFKGTVLGLIKENQLTGTPIDGATDKAIQMYKSIKDGSMKWSDVPSGMYDIIRKLSLNQSPDSHGLIVRHGFIGDVSIRPTVPYSITKRRMEKLKDRNSMYMRQKDLRKMLRYNYFKQHPVVDTHGMMDEYLRRLYRRPRPQYITPAVKVVADPNIQTPAAKKLLDGYAMKWKNLKAQALNDESHGKAILVNLKSNPKYGKWDHRKRYKYLKAAMMLK